MEAISIGNDGSVTLERIALDVMAETGLSWDVISGKCRKTDYVTARQAFCFVARITGAGSLYGIGRLLNKDHATVANSYKKFKTLLEAGDRVATQLFERLKLNYMSSRKQTIVIEPSDGCDNTSERFELDGFECPYCNGRGWHSVYEGKNQDAKQCPRCGGSGRLRARVIVEWLIC